MVNVTIERRTAITERQQQVVALIAAGCTNDQVGQRLGISPRTAKAHSDVLRAKLGVSRRRYIPGAFRALIDLAIAHGGRYYLTYHRWARRDQVERCYPQMPAFLGLKRQHDPAEVFQSTWYRHYRTMFTRAQADL